MVRDQGREAQPSPLPISGREAQMLQRSTVASHGQQQKFTVEPGWAGVPDEEPRETQGIPWNITRFMQGTSWKSMDK